MMIKVWAFDFNKMTGRAAPNHKDPVAVQRTFDQNLERLSGLEDIGFEGVFFSEHHFIESLLPNPALLIAALAKMTKRMHIGAMGHVLAFHQPWRLAEDLAMLDYITNGRLEIGFASGVPPEFLFVGIPQENVRPMYAEALDFLLKAFAEPIVSQQGEFYNYDEIYLMPRLKPVDRRRLWMTCYSPETAAKAARLDSKICSAYRPVDQIAKTFDAYRAAASDAGRDFGPDDLGIRRQILICPTDAEADALHAETLALAQERTASQFAIVDKRLHRELGRGASEGVKQTGVVDADAPAQAAEPRRTAAPSMVSMTDEFIYGSPRTVAEKIMAQCSATGAGNIMAYHSLALEDDELRRNYELWAQVVPMLSRAGVAV